MGIYSTITFLQSNQKCGARPKQTCAAQEAQEYTLWNRKSFL